MSATTTTRPLGLGRTLSDIAVIVRRDLVRNLRLPDVLVTSTVMPVIFILMFTYVFGGAIQSALPPAAHGRIGQGQAASAQLGAEGLVRYTRALEPITKTPR